MSKNTIILEIFKNLDIKDCINNLIRTNFSRFKLRNLNFLFTVKIFRLFQKNFKNFLSKMNEGIYKDAGESHPKDKIKN